ncbi:MAG: pilus assembly protein PilM [Candidatus Harrisonbacteria bacterium]|nr:pilus assembly protein PilM [Candidatus Harrisonbacteria bacterium]
MKLLPEKSSLALKKFFKNERPIAGLEIKDVAIRICQLQNDGSLKKSAVILEPGIIENGRIKDKEKLAENLKRLHQQFSLPKEKTPVILLVPSINVYTQVFNLPPLADGNLADAAKLNLVGISPIDLNLSYADWEKIGVREQDGRLEILGAFANSMVINEYIGSLVEAGFVPVAVEFPALALARSIKEFAAGVDIEKPQVVLNVSSDGIDFMVLRHGNLYFDYFTPWKLIQDEGRSGREILFSDFKETIIREIKKVYAFYGSHWEGRLEKLILVTQALNTEIKNFINENFQFDVIELKLNKFTDLPPSWFGVLGSMLRGRMSRAEDILISLMATGTEEDYRQSQIMFFVKSWRNIIAATLGFIILLFILVDTILSQASDKLVLQLQEIVKSPAGNEVLALQEQAKAFNQLLDKIFAARGQKSELSATLTRVNASLKNDVNITRILLDSSQSSALLTGKAADQSAAVNFKNTLFQGGFKNVSLPLSNIVVNPDKTVSFTLTFKL